MGGFGLLGLVFLLSAGRSLQTDVRGYGKLSFQWRLEEEDGGRLEFLVNGRTVERLETADGWRRCLIHLLDDDEYHLEWRGAGAVRAVRRLTSGFPVECEREIGARGGTVRLVLPDDGTPRLRLLGETAAFCAVAPGESPRRPLCVVGENRSGRPRVARIAVALEDEELDVAVERVVEIRQDGRLFPEENSGDDGEK